MQADVFEGGDPNFGLIDPTEEEFDQLLNDWTRNKGPDKEWIVTD